VVLWAVIDVAKEHATSISRFEVYGQEFVYVDREGGETWGERLKKGG
jgi:hypothetical protein